jgi:glycosyltransferase involved in cell wall biosynthesis
MNFFVSNASPLPMTEPVSSTKPIRVVIQQPALPKYRIPVFQELARRPGIQLKVVYGTQPGLTNVEPVGFEGVNIRARTGSLLGGIAWHSPQWSLATPSEADVLILSWNVRVASLMPALLRAKKRGVPTILWGHGYSKDPSPWRDWMRESATRLSTALIFYNYTAAKVHVQAMDDQERVFVALNSLDQGPIQAARESWLNRPADLQAFRKEHGLDGPVILFVSRLDPHNSLSLLLKAMPKLTQVNPATKIVIVGKGEDEAYLKSLTRELGIVDKVRFVGAIYDEVQLAPWFLNADVLCYPQNIG